MWIGRSCTSPPVTHVRIGPDLSRDAAHVTFGSANTITSLDLSAQEAQAFGEALLEAARLLAQERDPAWRLGLAPTTARIVCAYPVGGKALDTD